MVFISASNRERKHQIHKKNFKLKINKLNFRAKKNEKKKNVESYKEYE